MSELFVQTIKDQLLYGGRLSKIRERSVKTIEQLDPFMKDLDPTLIVARQLNLDLVRISDRIFKFIKEVETQDINAFDAFEKTAKLDSELHQVLSEILDAGPMVMDRLSEIKKELGT